MLFVDTIHIQLIPYHIIMCSMDLGDGWIETNVIVMNGVKIGHGAIVGTGSVVVKDVPPYAVVGGNPAHIIRYRYDKDIIARLLKLEWWNYAPDILSDLDLQI